MNRRRSLRLLATGATLFLPGILHARSTEPSRKKGWAGGDQKKHNQFGAHWHYNWTPNGRNSEGNQFIPMIKRKADLGALGKVASRQGLTHILGYNEPERTKQGNLSVEEGLKLWPRLVAVAEKRNIQLGSPAPSSDAGGMNWLKAFMEQADRRKLRVDFIAVHWYRGRDADQFEDFVKQLARDYRRPIWITEWNGWSGPEKEHYNFVKDSLRFLERSRDVERYAYFNPKAGSPHSLLKKDGSVSRIGELYRDAGA